MSVAPLRALPSLAADQCRRRRRRRRSVSSPGPPSIRVRLPLAADQRVAESQPSMLLEAKEPVVAVAARPWAFSEAQTPVPLPPATAVAKEAMSSLRRRRRPCGRSHSRRGRGRSTARPAVERVDAEAAATSSSSPAPPVACRRRGRRAPGRCRPAVDRSSLPRPPWIRSSPAPPQIRSLPRLRDHVVAAPPQITSRPGVPRWDTSGPSVPTISPAARDSAAFGFFGRRGGDEDERSHKQRSPCKKNPHSEEDMTRARRCQARTQGAGVAALLRRLRTPHGDDLGPSYVPSPG